MANLDFPGSPQVGDLHTVGDKTWIWTGVAWAVQRTSVTGKSAYELAIQNGFVGTEAEWLASLIGPAGATGQQGPAGATGSAGPKGDPGTPGTNGTDGTAGTDGVGVPAGGGVGMVLAKNSNTDFDTHWITPEYLTDYTVPLGGNQGQFLGKSSGADGDFHWLDLPTTNPDDPELPTGGQAGQVLTKNSSTTGDISWKDVPSTAAGIPDGGTDGQVLIKTGSNDGEAHWQNIPVTVPSGGLSGQVLTKISDSNGDVTWLTPGDSDTPTAHYYWRLWIANPVTGATSLNLSEVEFRTAVGGLSVTTNGTTFSSGLASGSVDNAFDGSTSTTVGFNPITNAYVGYHFVSQEAIVEVAVYPGNNAQSPGQFWVEYSDEGENWTKVGPTLTKASWTTGVPAIVNLYPEPITEAPGDGQIYARHNDDWLSVITVPAGGTTGQLLAKSSGADGAVVWENAPTTLPTGGTVGQVLTKNSSSNGDSSWANPLVGEAPNDGNQYVRQSGAWSEVVTSSSSLSELTDVDENVAPTNGQFLTYDSASTKWKPGSINALPPLAGNAKKILSVKPDESGVEWDVLTDDSIVQDGAHRFWRFHVLSNQGGTYNEIFELVLKTEVGGPDIAVGGTPIGDSNPANAFDQSDLTSAGGSNVGYDFGANNEKHIVEVEIWIDGYIPHNPSSGNIQWSDDGSVWNVAWPINNLPSFATHYVSTDPSYYNNQPGLETISSDANFTLQFGVDKQTVVHSGALTADRTVTLSTTNMKPGANFRIFRDGTGGFGLNIGSLVTLSTNDWVDVSWDAVNSVWAVTGQGTVGDSSKSLALDDLTDVDTSSATNGQVLTFDTASNQWKAADPTGGSETVAGAHRYWRINVSSNHGDTYTGMSELVMRTTPGGSDVCIGGTPTGLANANLFDQNPNTTASNAGGGGVFGYDFGAGNEKLIVEVEIWAPFYPNQMPNVFTIQYSDDGSAYTTAWTVNGTKVLSSGQPQTFTNPSYYNNVTGTETISSDANITLQFGVDNQTIIHTGTLTANRTVTVSTTNNKAGAKFRFIRTGGGAFVLNIGALVALNQNDWADIEWNTTTSAWLVTAKGTIGTITQSLVGLSDVDITTPTNGQVVTYNTSESKWVAQAPVSSLPVGGSTGQILAKTNGTDYNVNWINVPAAGATVFTGLSDVPHSYTGQAGMGVRVNVAETGLEYYEIPTSYYSRIAGFATFSPAANEKLMLHPSTDAFTFPANFSGSQFIVASAPTSGSWIASVQKNGTTVGTVTVTTAGVVTLATTSGATVSIAAGDVISLVAPATADIGIGNMCWNFKGLFS